MKNTFVILFTFLALGVAAQNVVISEETGEADISALLDVQSTDKGLLIPRMTEAQRTIISTPATGLVVYQTDGEDGFYFFNGTAWTGLIDGEEEDPVFHESVAADITDAGSGIVISTNERTKLNEIEEGASFLPVGTVIPFAGTNDKIPDGWLLCDGEEYSRTDYAGLFEIIGENWGDGNESTTFNIPDLRGRFLRGVDHEENVDPDFASRTDYDGNVVGAVVGSYQEDAFQGHAHNAVYRKDASSAGGSNDYGHPAFGEVDDTNGVGDVSEYGTYGTPRATTETRPKNAYVNYIIKY